MKTFTHIFLAIVLLSFVACQKDSLTPRTPDAEDYFPLAVGNQWEYEVYNTNSDGEERLATTETLKVIGTREIGSQPYFELERGRNLELFFPQFLRISDLQLIDEEGKLFLSLADHPEVFQRDTVYTGAPPSPLVAFHKLVNETKSTCTVPAGNFTCLDINTRIIPFDPDYPFGERVSHDYFSADVGLVQKNLLYYNSDQLQIEIRLSSFILE